VAIRRWLRRNKDAGASIRMLALMLDTCPAYVIRVRDAKRWPIHRDVYNRWISVLFSTVPLPKKPIV